MYPKRLVPDSDVGLGQNMSIGGKYKCVSIAILKYYNSKASNAILAPKSKQSRRKMRNKIDRLTRLIYNVDATATFSLEAHAEQLAKILLADFGTYQPNIVSLLSDAIITKPEKCGIYATVVALVNAKNGHFGEVFVHHMMEAFISSLTYSKWYAARHSLRFLADLVNCHVVSASSMLQLLHRMVDVSVHDDVPKARRDWYLFAVLSTLPWVGRYLHGSEEQALEALLLDIGTHLNMRSKNWQKKLRVWSVDTPHPQEEYLDCLWAQIRRMRVNNWMENFITRPYTSFDCSLREARKHNLPRIGLPLHNQKTYYPMASVVYRMFDSTDCPDGPPLPEAHSIERFLIEEHLKHKIDTLHPNPRECAIQLLQLPNKTEVPWEYCIVESIFAEMFSMPRPHYPEHYYGSVLVELCKLQPSPMTEIIQQATDIIFLRMDSMNQKCSDIFVNWFSNHLSNPRWQEQQEAGCSKDGMEHSMNGEVVGAKLAKKAKKLGYDQALKKGKLNKEAKQIAKKAILERQKEEPSHPNLAWQIRIGLGPSDWPKTKLSQEQLDLIQRAVLKRVLMDIQQKPIRFNETVYKDGWLQMVCMNSDTAAWLREQFPAIREDCKIDLKLMEESPKRFLVRGNFPICASDTDSMVLRFIANRNKLPATEWKVVSRKVRRNKDEFVFEVNKWSWDLVGAMTGAAAYKSGSVQLRAITSTEDDDNIKTENRSDQSQ